MKILLRKRRCWDFRKPEEILKIEELEHGDEVEVFVNTYDDHRNFLGKEFIEVTFINRKITDQEFMEMLSSMLEGKDCYTIRDGNARFFLLDFSDKNDPCIRKFRMGDVTDDFQDDENLNNDIDDETWTKLLSSYYEEHHAPDFAERGKYD